MSAVYSNEEYVKLEQDLQSGELLKSASINIPESLTAMGAFYLTGIGVCRNYDTAIAHFRKAVDKDYRANYFLGAMYRDGRGVRRNIDKARALFKEAAHQGVVKAQYDLGDMLESNFSGKAEQAYIWFSIAKANGADDVEEKMNLLEEKITKSDPKRILSVQHRASILFDKIKYKK